MSIKTPERKKQVEHVFANAQDRMLSDDVSLAILRERTKKLAVPSNQKKEEELNGIQYVRFRLGEKGYYGVPFTNTMEIIHKPLLTKVPNTSDFMAGVINHRGFLLNIIDLKKIFHIGDVDKNEEFIIIIHSKKIIIGVLVDNIEGIFSYKTNELRSPLSSKGIIKQECIMGLDQGFAALLNVDVLISEIQHFLDGSKG